MGSPAISRSSFCSHKHSLAGHGRRHPQFHWSALLTPLAGTQPLSQSQRFGPAGSPGAQAWETLSPLGCPLPCSPRGCPGFSFLFLLAVRISGNAAVPETMRQDAHPLYKTSPAHRPTTSQGLGPTEVALWPVGASLRRGRGRPGQTAQPSPAQPGCPSPPQVPGTGQDPAAVPERGGKAPWSLSPLARSHGGFAWPPLAHCVSLTLFRTWNQQ